MAGRETHAEEATEGVVVTDDPLENVWHISRGVSHNTNIFGTLNKLYCCLIDVNWFDQLGIIQIL